MAMLGVGGGGSLILRDDDRSPASALNEPTGLQCFSPCSTRVFQVLPITAEESLHLNRNKMNQVSKQCGEFSLFYKT